MAQIAGLLEKIFVHRDKPPVFRLFIYAAYVVPPIAVALLTWHEMTNTELVWQATEVIRPHDAYQQESTGEAWSDAIAYSPAEGAERRHHWQPTDAYKKAFLKEFSKSYFNHASRFDVFSPGTERASLTVILRNDAASRSIFVNSISVVAMLEDERPFDWRELDVSAELSVAAGDWDGSLVFNNDGIGPLLNLVADLTADQGFSFESFTPEDPIEDQETAQLSLGQPDYLGPFPDDGDERPETLYRIIGDGEIVPNEQAVIDCTSPEPRDDRCYDVVRNRYEEITTLARLGELADIKKAKTIDIDYSFEDLKGNESSGKQTVSLPTPVYWYRTGDHLLDELPLTDEALASMAYGSAPDDGWGSAPESAHAMDQVIDFAKQVFGVSDEEPKGVELITTKLDIDAANLPECGIDQAIDEPRTLLQGSGFVSISVDMENPRNGRYLFRILVNGEDRHAFSIDLFVPDELWFDGDTDTTRFVSYEDEPAPVCGIPPAQPPSG